MKCNKSKVMKKYTAQDLEQLTKTELITIILQQQEMIVDFAHRLSCLEKDSSNSSKSPSSDVKKVIRRTNSLRKKSGKKSGGQEGHKGATRKQAENPDEIITLKPEICESCEEELTDKICEVFARRQEIDIPPIKPIYTEYQAMQVICRCGQINKASFPEHLNSALQLGPRIKSVITYLSVVHSIPYRRLTHITWDMVGFSLSEGSVDNILKEATEKSLPIWEKIKEMVKSHSWTGGDETGVKVCKERWWKWVWQNVKGSLYAVSPSRGYKVVKEYFGEDYEGSLVHDCWSAQNNTVAKMGHQLCHAHLIRDLWYSVEKEGSRWSYKMIKLFQKANRARDIIWEEINNQEMKENIRERYEKGLDKLLEIELNHITEKKLQKRLRKHREKILYFMNSPDMPSHNNSSEQAIRQAKIKQKVSGGFRSEAGAKRYAIILSVIETCKKQNLDIFESIQKVITGQPLNFQGAE
jgi:transposase